MTIVVQLLEIMRIIFYVVAIFALLGGVLLLLLHKKFKERHHKTIKIFAIVLILYGVYVLTFGLYCVNTTIAYHSAL